jgi:uncharacterized membrane protein YfcA
MMILGFALAAVVGLTLGLLGGGGSILTVPVLVYVLGFAAKPAIVMSLPVVGLTALIGAALHYRLGNVRLGTAASFGVVAMIGAFAGARLSPLLDGGMQLAILATVMLGAAISMLRSRELRTEQTAPPKLAPLLGVALGVGVLTGLIGIGAGFLVVPAPVVLGRVPMRQAVGTSLLVIAMNSASGFAGYIGVVHLDWTFLLQFTSLAIAGALAGSALAARVPVSALKRGFAFFLIAMSGFVLYQNRSVFHLGAAATAVADR